MSTGVTWCRQESFGAGGEVDHFGMPVDPGNLLLLAHHGDVPVVGLPGCARSPKENGFDWVLWRLLADVPVNREDVMRHGRGRPSQGDHDTAAVAHRQDR